MKKGIIKLEFNEGVKDSQIMKMVMEIREKYQDRIKTIEYEWMGVKKWVKKE